MADVASPPSFSQPRATSFVPDGVSLGAALARTTHLGVGAHQDDLEILAIDGILACFGRSDRWFTGVVVTDGAGSPSPDRWRGTLSQKLETREREQRKAAVVGEYSAVIQLAHTSGSVKAADASAVLDLGLVLRAARPEVVYTHDLADRHDTHVAVALRVIEAALELPPELRPARLIGCEVWRDLDWMSEEDRVCLALPERGHLELALLGVFDSQIAGGKRYDSATYGRRRARATFAAPSAPDEATAIVLGMDLTPALSGTDPAELLDGYLERFTKDVRDRLARARSTR